MARLGTEASTINYEMVRTGKTPFGTFEGDSFRWNDAVKMVVFDEVHRCKGRDTRQSELLVAAKRQNLLTLSLSATPAESPLDLRALGYSLGLHGLDSSSRRTLGELLDNKPEAPSFYAWAARHGCRRGLWGFTFVGDAETKAKHMLRIHEALKDRTVRVRIADIPDFPETQITTEIYDVEDPSRVDRLYAEMAAAIKALHERKALDKCPEHPTTVLTRRRQELELLMVPALDSLVRDTIAQHRSALVFVSYRQTMEVLRDRLQDLNPGLIWGGQLSADREDIRKSYQDYRRHLIVAQYDAGGVGISLHDLRKEWPPTSFILPGFSATSLKQVFGRPHRWGGAASIQRVVFPACDVGKRLHRNLRNKSNLRDTLTNADLNPDNLPITGELNV